MKALAIALIMTAAALPAGSPIGFDLWKSGEMPGLEKSLAAKITAQKVAAQVLVNYGNHSVMVAHREGDGEAELHETQNDVIVVESGEATLVVGGVVVDPRTTAPHEVRGPSIRGGEQKPLAPGDIVHIPIQTAHQMLVASGKQITYFVVKIDAP